MELYIVLAIMAFMIVGFLLNKWPFGLTTMTCCVLLALTGVFTIPEAFAGFCNKTLILLVGMFGMVSAFQKTSVVDKIQAQMLRLKGKSGMALVIGLYVVVIGLACFMPTTANMVVMLMFLVGLGDSGEVTPHPYDHPSAGHDRHLGFQAAHRHGRCQPPEPECPLRRHAARRL